MRFPYVYFQTSESFCLVEKSLASWQCTLWKPLWKPLKSAVNLFCLKSHGFEELGFWMGGSGNVKKWAELELNTGVNELWWVQSSFAHCVSDSVPAQFRAGPDLSSVCMHHGKCSWVVVFLREPHPLAYICVLQTWKYGGRTVLQSFVKHPRDWSLKSD